MRAVTVGIVSIGDMGLGMAKLLQAHGYRVITVAEGRRYVGTWLSTLEGSMKNKSKTKTKAETKSKNKQTNPLILSGLVSTL